jgi:hypothetical protein
LSWFFALAAVFLAGGDLGLVGLFWLFLSKLLLAHAGGREMTKY